MVDLSEPRDLNAEERVLPDFILAGPNVRRELRAQGDSAEVVSACDCGSSKSRFTSFSAG